MSFGEDALDLNATEQGFRRKPKRVVGQDRIPNLVKNDNVRLSGMEILIINNLCIASDSVFRGQPHCEKIRNALRPRISLDASVDCFAALRKSSEKIAFSFLKHILD
jgi:hypothetical protein